MSVCIPQNFGDPYHSVNTPVQCPMVMIYQWGLVHFPEPKFWDVNVPPFVIQLWWELADQENLVNGDWEVEEKITLDSDHANDG